MLDETSSPIVSSLQEARVRILVVEDHTISRLALVKAFRECGADAVGARDGMEALEYLTAERFDVLVTDIWMPRMDGIELLSKCETLPPAHQPRRIIAVSGQFSATILQGRKGVEFLAKPVDLNALLDMLLGKPN